MLDSDKQPDNLMIIEKLVHTKCVPVLCVVCLADLQVASLSMSQAHHHNNNIASNMSQSLSRCGLTDLQAPKDQAKAMEGDDESQPVILEAVHREAPDQAHKSSQNLPTRLRPESPDNEMHIINGCQTSEDQCMLDIWLAGQSSPDQLEAPFRAYTLAKLMDLGA